MSDEFLVFLDDGETYSGVGGNCAVLRGGWDMPEAMRVWNSEYDDDDDMKAFQSGIEEVLLLNDENLLKIREKLPELWVKWENKTKK